MVPFSVTPTIHDLRHTFATRLVQAGVDLYTIQALGRWKTLSMVKNYAHHNTDTLRVGIDNLNSLREKYCHNFVTIDVDAKKHIS